jgi:molecular chaperone HscC
VECRFSYDASGLLEVDIHVPETGESRQLVVVDDEDGQDETALEKRRAELARLKLHPREDDVNRAVIERAKRCYESRLGDMRQYVGSLLSQFEGALDTQDPKRVAAAREEIVKALDEVEGERFL